MAECNTQADTVDQRSRHLSQHSLHNATYCLAHGNYGRAFAHYLLCLKLTPDMKSQIKADFTLALREWTEELEHAGRFDDMFNCYQQANDMFPECDTALNIMGAQLFRLGYVEEAASSFRRALRIDQSCLDARDNLESVCSHLLERWHFRMLNDKRRNTAFKVAIQRAVTAGHHTVLDIGAGEGLLSMLAVEAGAKTVYACEMSKPIYEIACDVLEANKMKDKISLIHNSSLDMTIGQDIPERVSLVVTETVDVGLLGENILSTVHHAWQHLLWDDCESQIIPAGATVFGCLVESDAIREENGILQPFSYDLDISNVELTCDTTVCSDQPYSTINLKRLPSGYKQLSDVFQVADFDFNNRQKVSQLIQGFSNTLSPRVTQSGQLDAVVTWFELNLDDRVKLSTGPESMSCWEQAVYPVLPCHFTRGASEDLHVKAGDVVTITVDSQRDCLHLKCSRINQTIHTPTPHDPCDNVTLEQETANQNSASMLGENFHSATRTLVKNDLVKNGTNPSGTFVEKCVYDRRHSVTCSDMEIPATQTSDTPGKVLYTLERGQIRKLNDMDYNCAVATHIKRTIEHGCLNVLVCCHGFSLTGLQATMYGAGRVLMTVGDDELQQLVRVIQKKNGIGTEVVQFESDLRNCSRVYDMMVVDVVEPCGILRLQILEEIALARLYCLTSEAVVVPGKVTVHGVLVESTHLRESNHLVDNKRTLGFNVAQFINDFQMRNHVDVCLATCPHRKLSEAFTMFEFNFNESFNHSSLPSYLEQRRSIKIPSIDSGEVMSLVYWFDLQISDDVCMSTLSCRSHFKQAALMLKAPLSVVKDQLIDVEVLCKNSNFYVTKLETIST